MTLFLVATPIGNLQDISERALATLREVDLILCEDTRTSLKLIRRFEIEASLKAFHKFNENAELEAIIERLKNGEKIALISDAGTPGLCDPGQILVKKAREENLTVTPIPGPCSVISALVASGLTTHPFTFSGFLEKAKKARSDQLKKALEKPETQLFFESPERILSTLEELQNLEPQRLIALAKEISKIYETFFLGTASEAVTWLSTRSSKGEWILMLEGKPPLTEAPLLAPELSQALTYVHRFMERGLSTRDAILAASEISGLKPQELYKATSNE
jgi:16S rRNA (cytidine1402-2'-O)-methyltransferase